MKWFMIFWGGPVGLLFAWYFLSLNDMSFGIFMLTREAHDLVFTLYGNILGIDPAILPGMVLRAIVFDSFLVLALIAFRRRRKVFAWWQARQAKSSGAAASLASADNLSNAPDRAFSSKV